jgi:hypothetical protein
VAKFAVFGLVRGYPDWRSKWRYSMQILRNLSIRLASLRTREKWLLLVFHEGNISKLDQIALQILSLGPISFHDVSHEFVRPAHLPHSGNHAPLGYSLMCRFNYLQIWDHISAFEVAMRLDEDCFLWRAPKMSGFRGFGSAGFCSETDVPTNQTLPKFLSESGKDKFYDHHFPYTNFYLVSPGNWQHSEVKEFLDEVGNHPDSLENRWGDIPVIGIALKLFPNTLGPIQHMREVSYIHLSHIAWVRNGEFKGVDFVFDIRKPIKSLNAIRKSL